VAVRYMYTWTCEHGSSEYKHIVLAFCHIHSVDVLVTINMILLLVSLIVTVDEFCVLYLSVVFLHDCM